MSKLPPQEVASVEAQPRPLYRKIANTTTDIRLYGSHILRGAIVETGPKFRSWKMAAAAASLIVTDSLDGWFGRRSNIDDQEYVKKDIEADEDFYENIMEAIGFATGDIRYSGYVASTKWRNEKVEDKRAHLRERRLQSGARNLGKFKTLLQNTGIILDLSPVGEKSPRLVHGIHMLAVGAMAISGADIVIDADRQLAQHNAQAANKLEIGGTDQAQPVQELAAA